jgi:monofunctional biosynthetic peptidoglycan transglycosylase
VARRLNLIGALARFAIKAGFALIGLFGLLVALYAFVDPVSTLMLARTLQGERYERIPVRLDAVAPAAVAAVIASEDATFCDNDGVDWDALGEVLRGANGGEPKRGASTITMQTAKNLFLWPGRSVVRKGIEIGMALVLDKAWSKRRVMENYLNVAEWGEGLFGIEAAARRYFHKPASRLDLAEGALLATALPNPHERNPARPRAFQRRIAEAVMARAASSADRLWCLRR